MRRKLVSALVSVVLAAGLCPLPAFASQEGGRLAAASGNVKQTEQVTTQASSPRATLKAVAYYPIRYFKYLNGSKTQAVGVTGNLDSNGGVQYGTVWFVNGNSAWRIYTASGALYKGYTKLCKVKGGHIFKVEQGGYGSGSTSYAWSIRNGRVTEIPSIGMAMTQLSRKQFSIVRQDFDELYGTDGSHTGHTWNAYYYRWNGKRFIEYGGKAISKARFKKAKNGAHILKAIKRTVKKKEHATAKINRIYYRANGIVNVNYSYRHEYGTYRYNVKLKYKSGKLSFVKTSNYRYNSKLGRATAGGWYKPCGGSASGIIDVSYPKRLPEGLR